MPHIPSNDYGTWRRLRVVEFKSQFVDYPDPDNQYEYQKDIDLSDKLEAMKETFMSIIIKYYKIYHTIGLKEPEEVLAYTKSYQQKNDFYMEFAEDIIEETENKKDIVKIEELYNMFKNWYKESQGDSKCPARKNLKEYIERRYGKYNNGWRNIKIKYVDEDDYNDDIEKEYETL